MVGPALKPAARNEAEVSRAIAIYALATHRHLLVLPLNMKPTVRGRVVEPLLVVGTLTVEFSVPVQPIVSATAEKS